MGQDPYEQHMMVGTRRSRRWALLLMAVAAMAIAGWAIWTSPGGNAGKEIASGRVRDVSGQAGPVGTTGERDGVPNENAGPSARRDIIRDVETITGTNDGQQFVGRHFEVTAPVQQHINDVAFWVGPDDNRLLVVLSRDNRDGAARQQSVPSSTALGQIPAGGQATIAGTIERVPYAEAMYSWGLTNADRDELMDRRIYLKAESITVTGG